MKKMKHISYSGFTLFESDPELFYKRYLTENRPPREPQNHYMAVGSAFDAFVKAELHDIFVNDGDPKFTAEALFEAQVEPHNRDRARPDGLDVLKWYKNVGAFRALTNDMNGCINPQFESEITGEVTVSRLEGGVPILGKPDVKYIHRHGARVVHDFKVQGYYSKQPKAPSPGYLREYPLGRMYKTCIPKQHKGFEINGNGGLHMHCPDWAEQLSMYAWVMGEDVGSDYILTIDQICCDSQKKTIRVAKHAATVNDIWQHKLFDRIHRCWTACMNGHVFLNVDYELNKRMIETLEAELASKPPQEFLEATGRIR